MAGMRWRHAFVIQGYHGVRMQTLLHIAVPLTLKLVVRAECT
jgi:hypothetical protein